MGKKPKADRVHLFLYCAGMLAIVVSGYGCGVTANIQKSVQARKQLDQAGKLFAEGNYQGALSGYEKTAALFPETPPGDRAVFSMGIILAHPDNPRRNYQKALDCFHKVTSDFPGSPLRNKAKAWTATINELVGYKAKVNDLENQLKELKEIDISTEKKKRQE
ncbi:MAG: hypothetical protein K9K82_03175 [Desulfobacteraceae bacterium]|nr:hypothetical protein [Desulfobacteraceae bacterium]